MPLFSEPNRQKKPMNAKWFLQIPIISWDSDMFSVPEVVFGEYLGNSFQEYYKHNNWGSSAVWAEIRWPNMPPFAEKKKRAGEWTAGYGAGVKGFQTPGDVVKIYDWKSFRNTIPTLLFKYGCLIRYFAHMIFSWQGTGHFKTCWGWPILVPQKNNGTPKRVVIQKGSNIHNTSSQRL